VLAWSQERVLKEEPVAPATEAAGEKDAPDSQDVDAAKQDVDKSDKGESDKDTPKSPKKTTKSKKKVEVEDDDDENDDGYETVTHYLVKWRSLAYEESTWELDKDVDNDKVDQFHERQQATPERLKEGVRPTAADWRKVNKNPTFKNGNQLREYQLEGLNWLLFCWYNR
jgi:SNF2 family DNA or RNA helicase